MRQHKLAHRQSVGEHPRLTRDHPTIMTELCAPILGAGPTKFSCTFELGGHTFLFSLVSFFLAVCFPFSIRIDLSNTHEPLVTIFEATDVNMAANGSTYALSSTHKEVCVCYSGYCCCF